MDLNELSIEQQQRFMRELFSHIDWFQADGRLRNWDRLKAFESCRSTFSRSVLRAWLDRLDIMRRVGLGWMGSGCRYQLDDGEHVDLVLERYMQAAPVSEFTAYSAEVSDKVFVSPRVGNYDLDLVMGRYELDYLGPDHEESIRKQQPVAVMCNDRHNADLTPEDHQALRFTDEAVCAHGLKVIRFSADEVEADPEACARRIDEMFVPTWCCREPGKSEHPYDLLMRRVLGRWSDGPSDVAR